MYGIETDDYLPSQEKDISSTIRMNSYKSKRNNFNLPEAFYYIGAPVFLLILLRVIAIFIKIFEDERKDHLKDKAKKLDKD